MEPSRPRHPGYSCRIPFVRVCARLCACVLGRVGPRVRAYLRTRVCVCVCQVRAYPCTPFTCKLLDIPCAIRLYTLCFKGYQFCIYDLGLRRCIVGCGTRILDTPVHALSHASGRRDSATPLDDRDLHCIPEINANLARTPPTTHCRPRPRCLEIAL